jgi:hypothetical protein
MKIIVIDSELAKNNNERAWLVTNNSIERVERNELANLIFIANAKEAGSFTDKKENYVVAWHLSEYANNPLRGAGLTGMGFHKDRDDLVWSSGLDTLVNSTKGNGTRADIGDVFERFATLLQDVEGEFLDVSLQTLCRLYEWTVTGDLLENTEGAKREIKKLSGPIEKMRYPDTAKFIKATLDIISLLYEWPLVSKNADKIEAIDKQIRELLKLNAGIKMTQFDRMNEGLTRKYQQQKMRSKNDPSKTELISELTDLRDVLLGADNVDADGIIHLLKAGAHGCSLT